MFCRNASGRLAGCHARQNIAPEFGAESSTAYERGQHGPHAQHLANPCGGHLRQRRPTFSTISGHNPRESYCAVSWGSGISRMAGSCGARAARAQRLVLILLCAAIRASGQPRSTCPVDLTSSELVPVCLLAPSCVAIASRRDEALRRSARPTRSALTYHARAASRLKAPAGSQ